MHSSNLANSQSTAELCLNDDVLLFPCEDPRNGYLAVKRNGVWVRLCPWCEEPLPPSKRKPFKFCNNKGQCRKHFERHGGLRKNEWRVQQNEIYDRTHPPKMGWYAYITARVDVGVKQAAFSHKESVGTKSIVKPLLVHVGIKDTDYVSDRIVVAKRPEMRPRPVHHQVDDLDRPSVPEPTTISFEHHAVHGSGDQRLGGKKPNGRQAVRASRKKKWVYVWQDVDVPHWKQTTVTPNRE